MKRSPSGNPWNIDIASLRTPRDFIAAAVLAPSSHNSQPWKFSCDDSTLEISIELSRRLKESDPDDRQAFISLGAAVANVEVAAAYQGLKADVVYTDTGARISFALGAESALATLAPAIVTRATNRSIHVSGTLPSGFSEHAHTLALSDAKVTFVENNANIAELGAIAIKAAIAGMESKGFRRELAQHVLSNTSSKKVGMPGFGLGFPTLVSFVVPTMIRFINVAKLSRAQDEKLFRDGTTALVIISTSEDTKACQMDAGRVYERIALYAASCGLSVAPWGAPVEMDAWHKKVEQVAGTAGRVQVFARIGKPHESVRHSPRISAETLISS